MCSGYAAKCYLQAASCILGLKVKPGENPGFFVFTFEITRLRRLQFLGLWKWERNLIFFLISKSIEMRYSA